MSGPEGHPSGHPATPGGVPPQGHTGSKPPGPPDALDPLACAVVGLPADGGVVAGRSLREMGREIVARGTAGRRAVPGLAWALADVEADGAGPETACCAAVSPAQAADADREPEVASRFAPVSA